MLPNATETRIVVTGNYRAWRHFIGMRATEHADVEIREVAVQTLRQLQRVASNIFADFTIDTLADGIYEIRIVASDEPSNGSGAAALDELISELLTRTVDVLRADTAAVIGRLKKLGVEHVVMLTGDNRTTALAVARKLEAENATVPAGRLRPGEPTYNEPAALDLRGTVSVPRLAAALSELVRRHEAFRCRYGERDGEPVAIVRDADGAPLAGAYIDIGPADRGGETDRQIRSGPRIRTSDAVWLYDLWR